MIVDAKGRAMPDGGYEVIYADPAWSFSSNSQKKPGKNARSHYRCMTDQQICDLPVKQWAAANSLLLMWTTVPMLVRSLAVPEAWGFKYKSHVIWEKSRIGTGFWARNRHELLLICRRGKFPCPKPTLFPDSVIKSPTREHSRKPDWIRDRIAEVFADQSKLEMNARVAADGWHVWGDEYDKFQEQKQLSKGE